MNKAPDFWWRQGLSFGALCLAPVSWIFGAVSGRRMLEKAKYRSKLPVICIGNFVVGGTGKTPFALSLAEVLAKAGYKPGYLLRGYGGQATGPLLVDPQAHSSELVGDEALLLSVACPTVVSSDRPAGARLLEGLDVDIILMDDGFQNPALQKDLSLVLVDCATGIGNGFCIPAGPLRAPMRKQILKTDCLVLVGEGDAAEDVLHLAGRRGLPIVHAQIVPEKNMALEGRELFAFAGIGRPGKFFASLQGLGYSVKQTRSFADHHGFSEADVKTLLTEAEAEGLQLVTTAKDMVRLQSANGELYRWLEKRTEVLNISMQIADEQRLSGLVRETLDRREFHPQR